MPNNLASCHVNGSFSPTNISSMGNLRSFLWRLNCLYKSTTQAGHYAAQYWADIAVRSEHPLAPLAHIPGVFAALWTPDVAQKLR